jgi:hypothetical protein
MFDLTVQLVFISLIEPPSGLNIQYFPLDVQNRNTVPKLKNDIIILCISMLALVIFFGDISKRICYYDT